MKAYEVLAFLILLSGVLFIVNGPVRSKLERPQTPDAVNPVPDAPRVDNEAEFKNAGDVIAFTATWCGPCKAMKPVIARIKARGYNVKIVDVDTPEGQKFVAKYNVTSVPTYIFLKHASSTYGGEEYHRQTGALDEEAFCRILRGIGFVIRAVIKLVL